MLTPGTGESATPSSGLSLLTPGCPPGSGGRCHSAVCAVGVGPSGRGGVCGLAAACVAASAGAGAPPAAGAGADAPPGAGLADGNGPHLDGAPAGVPAGGA